jgi:hypothetical protein
MIDVCVNLPDKIGNRSNLAVLVGRRFSGLESLGQPLRDLTGIGSRNDDSSFGAGADDVTGLHDHASATDWNIDLERAGLRPRPRGHSSAVKGKACSLCVLDIPVGSVHHEAGEPVVLDGRAQELKAPQAPRREPLGIDHQYIAPRSDGYRLDDGKVVARRAFGQ